MTAYVGAIDQGTTSTRFIVFDCSGQVVSTAQQEHQQIYPRPGWVEHDPEEIWRNTQHVIAAAMRAKNLNAGDLAAIGITNQRETTILWDSNTGVPVYNAIVWQDTRVEDAVAELARDGGPDRFRQKTGLPLATYFSALKIRWILNNFEGAREKVKTGNLLFGTVDTFLLWQLTGGPAGGIHVTDVTNASRTQLMNLATLAWDREILEICNIPETILPRIRLQQRSLRKIAARRNQRCAHHGHPWRSTSRARRTNLLRTGRSQKHLRHGKLSADEHW